MLYINAFIWIDLNLPWIKCISKVTSSHASIQGCGNEPARDSWRPLDKPGSPIPSLKGEQTPEQPHDSWRGEREESSVMGRAERGSLAAAGPQGTPRHLETLGDVLP